MASTGKTSQLGLSLWEPQDRPERLDFRQDNEKLEEIVGSHLQSSMLHLTEAQRDYLQAPIWTYRYVGTGEVTYTWQDIGRIPQIILVLCDEMPPIITGSAKNTYYWDIWAAAGNYAGSVKVYPDEMKIEFSNTQNPMGHLINLNRKNCNYTVLCFGLPESQTA